MSVYKYILFIRTKSDAGGGSNEYSPTTANATLASAEKGSFVKSPKNSQTLLIMKSTSKTNIFPPVSLKVNV